MQDTNTIVNKVENIFAVILLYIEKPLTHSLTDHSNSL